VVQDPIRVNVGDVFEVRLEGVPTAGYRWALDLNDEQRELVELVATAWESPAGVLGGEATQAFRLRARRSGEAMLSFGYRRPWEPAAVAEKHITVAIV